jgi:hypothetical protein
VWDAKDECEVLVQPYIHIISGDNPMQAEECSSCGLRGNLFCRTCKAGGTRAYKMTEEGYSQQFEVSISFEIAI